MSNSFCAFFIKIFLCDFEGCFIVYLSYVYPIFIVYLSYIYSML